MIIPKQCYPIAWPAGLPRAKSRSDASFARMEPGRAIGEVYDELRRARAGKVIISSNMPLRSDGTPSADTSMRPGGDPGVAVYWTINKWRTGKIIEIPHCMPCDRWNRITDNLHAIALTIDAMRGMERWGATTIEQAFAGFAALPPGASSSESTARPWRDVIGGVWPADLDAAELLVLAKARFRRSMSDVHPDKGGSDELAAELNAAIAAAEAELSS